MSEIAERIGAEVLNNCPACNGTGEGSAGDCPCAECDGTGDRNCHINPLSAEAILSVAKAMQNI